MGFLEVCCEVLGVLLRSELLGLDRGKVMLKGLSCLVGM